MANGDARHRPGALLRGQVWRALAAVAGRDTATLKLLTIPAPRGGSISSPSLPPRGGKLPQWRPLHFESSSRISTRKQRDRKSTRLNSSHSQISYAVFCLKKKKKKIK